MSRRQPRYSKEEFARRGTEWYEQKIRPLVERDHHGRVVAIDIDTGDYQLGEDTLDACQPLIDRKPDAQIWCVRIGHRAVDRLGYHGPTEVA